MRAVLCHDYADPPRLTLGEVAAPIPAAGEVLVDVMQCVAEGQLRPLVAAELPLDHFDQALARLRDRRVLGRLVLRPR